MRGPHTDYFIGDPGQMIAHLNAETLSIIMIESVRAIENLDEILAVPDIDCVMIGPDDLSQDMGIPGELQNPKLLEIYDRIFEVCNKRQMPCGLSAQSPEMAQSWISKGARWVPYQNDAAMVFNAARAIVPKLMEIGGRAS